jgi:hypothetical protein
MMQFIVDEMKAELLSFGIIFLCIVVSKGYGKTTTSSKSAYRHPRMDHSGHNSVDIDSIDL